MNIKKVIMACIITAMTAGMLTGCGKKNDDNASSVSKAESSIAASENSESDSSDIDSSLKEENNESSEIEKDSPASDSSETETIKKNDDETIEEKESDKEETPQLQIDNNSSTSYTDEQSKCIGKLLDSLDSVDRIGGAALSKNDEDIVTENGNNYICVDSSDFSSVADIENYMKLYLTDNMISSRYSNTLSLYKDIDGKLYCLDAGKGCGFPFNKEKAEITESTESSFTISAPYDNFGSESILTINVVKENGTWKIDSIKN